MSDRFSPQAESRFGDFEVVRKKRKFRKKVTFLSFIEASKVVFRSFFLEHFGAGRVCTYTFCFELREALEGFEALRAGGN